MTSKRSLIFSFRAHKPLFIVLIVGLIHGFIYVFLIPPWQHYDEPKHFEYIWLLANRPGFPEVGDFDSILSQSVVKSMIDHDFYRGYKQSEIPEPNQPDLHIPGYSQLDDQPLYYILASIPIRIMPFEKIESQLFVARIISLSFLLITLVAAWGIMQSLTDRNSSMCWMVPLAIAMLPGFIDLMTAVNNASAAVAFFSLFIWSSVQTLVAKVSLTNLLWMSVTTLLCIFTNNIVWVAVPLFLLVLLILFLRSLERIYLFGAIILLTIVATFLFFSWGDASNWVRFTLQGEDISQKVQLAPFGERSFVLEPLGDEGGRTNLVYQYIPADIARSVRGSKVTVGAWVWATNPMHVNMPIINYSPGYNKYTKTVEVTEIPNFFAYTVEMPKDAGRIWISLQSDKPSDDFGNKIFYDGIIFLRGEYDDNTLPHFNDVDTKNGIWSQKVFTNLLRNASAENTWIRFHKWVDKTGIFIIPNGATPSLITTSLLDIEGTGNYYKSVSGHLLRTFWGQFGWGHVPLLGHKPYRLFLFITISGILGGCYYLWRKRNILTWSPIVFLALAMLLVWGFTITRGTLYLIHRPYYPTARYAYPVIVPTLLLLIQGWLEPLRWVERLFKPVTYYKFAKVIYCVFWALLALWALLSIYDFYYGQVI